MSSKQPFFGGIFGRTRTRRKSVKGLNRHERRLILESLEPRHLLTMIGLVPITPNPAPDNTPVALTAQVTDLPAGGTISLSDNGSPISNAQGLTVNSNIANSLYFSGDSQSYVQIPSMDNLGSFTFATWVRRDVTGTKQYDIMAGDYGGWGVYFGEGGNNDNLWFTDRGYSAWESTATFSDQQWHFIAVTYDGNNLTFFADGKIAGSAVVGASFATGDYYYLGGAPDISSDDTNQPLNGWLAQTLVYSRTLTSSDLSSLYNSGLGTADPGTTGLYAGYLYNESSGDAITSITDAPGSNLDGSIVGDGVAREGGFGYVTSTATLGIGSHTISAVDDQNTSVYASTDVTVLHAAAVTLTTTGAIVAGQPTGLTATVVDSDNTGLPLDGTVDFQDGGTDLGSVSVYSSGIATLTGVALASGVHNLTAVYSDGEVNFADSSASLTVAVQTSLPVTLSSTATTLAYGQSPTVTAALPSGASGALDFSVDGGTAVPKTLASSTSAMSFDGADGTYVQIPNMDLNNGLTFATWVKREVVGQKQYLIMSGGYGGWGVYFSEGNDNDLLWLTYRGYAAWCSNVGISDNDWHFVAVTLGDDTLTFYIDGQACGSQPLSLTFNSENGKYYLGGAADLPGDPGRALDGSMAATAIFDRGLTSLEIAELYNGGMGRTDAAGLTGLVAAYDYPEAAPYSDWTNSGNDGTPFGGVTWTSDGPVASATATYTPSIPLSVGTHSITAQYAGDSNFAASESSPLSVTVTPQTLYWDPAENPLSVNLVTMAGLGGDGTWNEASSNKDWYDPATGTDVPWSDGCTAILVGTGGHVTISGTVSAIAVTFDSDGLTVYGDDLALPAGGTTIDVPSGVSVTVRAAIIDESGVSTPGALTKIGAGMLTLDGANSYSAGTTVTAGTLQLGNGGSLGSGPVMDNAALVVNRNDTSTVANAVGGTGSLTEVNSGMLYVRGANTYSGGTAVSSSAALQVDDGGSLGSGGVTDNGLLIVNHTDTWTLANAISGNGRLAQVGTGTLILSGVNSYGGGTIINAGILNFAYGALGNGAVSFSGGAVGRLQWASGNTQDISDQLNVNNGGGSPVLDTNGNNVTFAGLLIGGTGFFKVGGGILTLTNSGNYHSYSGTIFVDGGTVCFTEGALGSGIIDMGGGILRWATGNIEDVSSQLQVTNGTLDTNGNNVTLSHEMILLGASITKAGAGTLTLGDGATLYCENMTIDAGTLQMGVGDTSGALVASGQITDNSTLILDRSDNITVTAPISGTGSVALDGSGTVTLAGQNSNTGGTIINAGALGSTSRIGPGPLVDNTNRDSGWYQFSPIVSAVDGTPLTPANSGVNFSIDTNWIFAGSVQAAAWIALSGLVTDGSVPSFSSYPQVSGDRGPTGAPSITGDSSQVLTIWHVFNPDPTDGYTYNPSLYPVGQSYPSSLMTPFLLPYRGLDPSATNPGQGGDPIGYADGSVEYSATDLSSPVLGGGLTQGRSWTNYTQSSSGQNNGNGWIDSSLPTITQVTGDQVVSVAFSGTNVLEFELTGGAYVPTTYTADTLIHDATDKLFILTDAQGNQYSFNDFTSGVAANLRGQFVSMTDAGGLLTAVTARNANGEPLTLTRDDATGQPVESLNYTYLSAPDPNAGLLGSVELKVYDAGVWTPVQQVTYSYYQGSYSGGDAYGNLGDLKTAVVTDAGGAVLDMEYYRYYTPADYTDGFGNTIGYVHALKYVFDTASYADLLAALGQSSLASTAAFSATDAEVSPYAELYYRYDAEHRVTLQTVQGSGGTASGGVGTYTFAYSNNPAVSDDTNTWQFKTIETTPNGSVNVVYCNASGEVVIKASYTNSSLADEVTAVYNQYNAAGQTTLAADSSAISGWTLDGGGNLVVTLNANAGTINGYDYYASTNATQTSAGGVTGYLEDSYVQQGTAGTHILQQGITYYACAAGSGDVAFVAADTGYQDGTLATAETTTYAYTWFSGTSRAETVTETGPTGATTEVVDSIYGQMVSSTDALGVETVDSYDALGRMTAITSNYVAGGPSTSDENVTTAYAYDPLGRVIQETDPAGNVTFFVYDDADQEIRTYSGWRLDAGTELYYPATNAAITVTRQDLFNNYSETLTYVWTGTGANALPTNADGSPAGTESLTSPYAVLQSLSRSLMNSAGQVVARREYFNLAGLAYSVSPALGAKDVNYYENDDGYGPDGDLISVIDALGNTSSYGYDALENRISTTDALGHTTTAAYNGDGKLIGVTDALGHTTSYAYNVLGEMVSVTDALGDEIHFTYDSFGDLLATTDRLGHTTTNTYDALGRLLTTKNAAGGTTSYSYDADGHLLTTTDPLGDTTTNTYDALGRLLTTTNAAGGTTSYSYDADGHLLTTTDPLGHTTTNTYDALGRLLTTTNAAGGTTSYGYDADGHLLTTTDPLGHSTTNTYDALGRLLTTTNAAGGTTSYSYDADSHLLTTTDPLGHSTTNTYDALGRLLTTTNAAGGTTSYSYDADENELTETDPDGNVTSYSYDSLNRLIGQSEMIQLASGATPVTAVTTLQYDADGDLLEKTDADGQVTTDSYDNAGRLIAEKWYRAGSSTPYDTLNYSYDADGELLIAQDGSSSYTYTYNSLGEQTSVDNNGSGPRGTTGTPGVREVLLNSTYDADGDRTQLAATIGGTADFVNGYSYSDLNQEIQVSQAASTATGADAVESKLVDFIYNADGQFDAIARYASPAGTSQLVATSSYGYDDLGRLTSLAQTAAATTDYVWTYDADADVLNFTDSAHADESVGSYSYDADGQLTGATPAPGQAANASNSLANAYDGNGNASSTSIAGTTTSTTIGTGNTLLSDGTFNYQYDADGNVVLRTRISTAPAADYQTLYTWDNRNRLTDLTFEDNSGKVTSEIHYTYDLFNNLIGRTYTTYESDGVTEATTTTQRYVFDGTNMVLAFDGSGDLTDRFLWGPAVDQVLADEQFSGTSQLPTVPGNTLWFLGDNQNSVRDVVNDAGTLEQHIAYSPFGQQSAQSSNPGNVDSVFGYTGTFTDPLTGYQLHGVRWYDPAGQRWLSQDPSGLRPDINPYRYVGNTPLIATDPSGLCKEDNSNSNDGQNALADNLGSMLDAAANATSNFLVGIVDGLLGTPAAAVSLLAPGDASAVASSWGMQTAAGALSAPGGASFFGSSQEIQTFGSDLTLSHQGGSSTATYMPPPTLSGSTVAVSDTAAWWSDYYSYFNPFTAPDSVDGWDTTVKVGQVVSWGTAAVGGAAAAVEGATAGGLAAAWGWLTGAGATTVVATGTGVVGAAETPEGQELLSSETALIFGGEGAQQGGAVTASANLQRLQGLWDNGVENLNTAINNANHEIATSWADELSAIQAAYRNLLSGPN